MTFEDFEKAKVIQDKLASIRSNIDVLERLIRNAYTCLPPMGNHVFELRGNTSLKLNTDLAWLEMVLKYYEKQEEELCAEFAALGRE